MVVRGDYLGTETELPPTPPKLTPTPELTLRCLKPDVWQSVRLHLLWESRKVSAPLPTSTVGYFAYRAVQSLTAGTHLLV